MGLLLRGGCFLRDAERMKMRRINFISSTMISFAFLMGASQLVLAGTADGKSIDVKLNVAIGCTVDSPPNFEYSPVAPGSFSKAFARS